MGLRTTEVTNTLSFMHHVNCKCEETKCKTHAVVVFVHRLKCIWIVRPPLLASTHKQRRYSNVIL